MKEQVQEQVDVDYLLGKMRKRMLLQSYAYNTINNYIYGVKLMLKYCKQHPEDLNTDDVFNFLVYLKEERKFSRNSMRIVVSGIRYLYNWFLDRPDIIKEIPYPKAVKYLPEVFTGIELKNVIERTANRKHRLLLMLIYSAGLRRGEVPGILLTDIDRKNMQIHIRQGKGGKDRFAQLSKHFLQEMDIYIEEFKPEHYLFNGRKKGSQLVASAMGWALKQAIKREGIKKKVGLHSLRHSFATHHLSIGTNLFMIKELLGHKHIQTTLLYLQYDNRMRKQVQNPLDVMFGK